MTLFASAINVRGRRMPDLNKTKVLLADDELQIRLLMKSIMTFLGYEVIGRAKNGIEAVEMYAMLRPDFLFLDILMPKKNGEEALTEIMSSYPDAKVIMLTGVSDRESVTKCINLGASGFIRKDNPIPELRRKISETVNSIQSVKGTSRE